MSTENNKTQGRKGNATKEKEERCSRWDISLIPNYSHGIHNWPVTQEISNPLNSVVLGLRAGGMVHFVPWLELFSFCPPLGLEFLSSYLPWWRLTSLTLIIILHPFLPIPATSPQRPLSSVPSVAVVERFDYAIILCSFQIDFRWPEMTRPSPQKSAL